MGDLDPLPPLPSKLRVAADADTVELCALLLEWRAKGVSPSNRSVIAETLRAAAKDLRAFLVEVNDD
jgi:hypothetical protein